MKNKRGKAILLTAGVLLPGVFRILGEVFGETMQTSVALLLLALAACVGITAISIYMATRALL